MTAGPGVHPEAPKWPEAAARAAALALALLLAGCFGAPAGPPARGAPHDGGSHDDRGRDGAGGGPM